MKFFTEPQTPTSRYIAIAVVFAALVTGSSSSLLAGSGNFGIRSDNKSCLKDLRTWKKHEGWKAIAITRTVGKAQGCGMVAGYDSPAEAKKEALRSCNGNVKYPIFKRRTACRIVALEK
jgi:hypothetical protein